MAEKRKRGNPNWQPGGKDYRAPSGAGWGGAARGYSREPITVEAQPDPAAKSAGHAGRKAMIERFEAKRMALAEKLLAIAETGETQTIQLAAINAVFDRVDGKPVQAVSGPDGAALPATIAVQFVKPGNV